MERDKRHLVSLTYPINNMRENRVVSLRITDGLSGECLFDADMDADTWVSIMSNTMTRVEGQVTDHPERIGKTLKCERVLLPTKQGDYRQGVPDWLAKEIKDRISQGWDEASDPHRDNAGNWCFTLRKWE